MGEHRAEHAIPLQILDLAGADEENAVQLNLDNLSTLCETLREHRADLVSIIAVMGSYRTGKSFLLDLLLRRMRTKSREDAAKNAKRRPAPQQEGWGDVDAPAEEEEEEKEAEEAAEAPAALSMEDELRSKWEFAGDDNDKLPLPGWVYDGNSTHIAEGKPGEPQAGFEYRAGKEKCTQGIWIWSQPFMFVNPEGQRVAVLLMDTQGAWDDTMTKHQSATIFGLTAMLSSKLIYNIQNKIEEGHIENLDYFTTFAQTAVMGLPGNEAPFGHLEVVIRDWAHYDDGWNFDQCRENMKEHLKEHMGVDNVPGDAKSRVERLWSTFRQIDCVGLVHPSLKITKSKWDGAIKDIDPDFFFLLDDFCSRFFAGDFPQPSSPLGCELTVGTFERSLINFVNAFRDSTQMAVGLRDAFVKVQTMTAREEILKHFKVRLAMVVPESSVYDPRVFDTKTGAIKEMFIKDFSQKLKPFRMSPQDEAGMIEEFVQQVDESMKVRLQKNDEAVEGGTMKLVASPVVGLTVFFIFNHHIIVYVGGPVAGYLTLKKHAEKQKKGMFSGAVVAAAGNDGKIFMTNRYKDVQAIMVATNRLTPTDVADAIQGAGAKAALAATAVQAAGGPAAVAQQAAAATSGAAKN